MAGIFETEQYYVKINNLKIIPVGSVTKFETQSKDGKVKRFHINIKFEDSKQTEHLNQLFLQDIDVEFYHEHKMLTSFTGRIVSAKLDDIDDTVKYEIENV